MSGFLLDTDVVSLLSPSRAQASPCFLGWLDRADGEGLVFLSVVTVHEIAKGVALLEGKGATTKAAGLKIWLAGLLAGYGERIIGLDGPAATLSGRLEATAILAGHAPGMADALIAGIAQSRGLVVVTRNARHFRSFGIRTVTPDEAQELPLP